MCSVQSLAFFILFIASNKNTVMKSFMLICSSFFFVLVRWYINTMEDCSGVKQVGSSLQADDFTNTKFWGEM